MHEWASKGGATIGTSEEPGTLIQDVPVFPGWAVEPCTYYNGICVEPGTLHRVHMFSLFITAVPITKLFVEPGITFWGLCCCLLLQYLL